MATENEQPLPPQGYESDLSGYRPVVFNGDQPIAWGFTLIKTLSDERFEALRSKMTFADDQWHVVAVKLTPAMAAEKYGPQTALDIGPRGGFRSVTFGTTVFYSRWLDPRVTP